jgi:hypothetical protein
MIIPKGKIIHAALSTSFTDINELLRDLSENSFTGCCQVSFWEYEGYLFMDTGKIVSALEELQKDPIIRSFGDKAKQNILTKAKEKDGTVTVFRLSNELVATLAAALKSTIVLKDLTTELTSLEKLVQKLRKEEHTGYIEIVFNNQEGEGYIYFQDGQVMETVYRSAEGEIVSGPHGLKKLLGLSAEVGSIFNVYKVVISGTVEDTSTPMEGPVLEMALSVFAGILSNMEKAVNEVMGRGKFVEVLKRVLTANANKYPFLDPFAGEFTYNRDGTLTFEGSVTTDEFIEGVSDIINQVVGEAAKKVPKDKILYNIRNNLQSLKGEKKQDIESFKLLERLPELLGEQVELSKPEGETPEEPKEKERKGLLGRFGLKIKSE